MFLDPCPDFATPRTSSRVVFRHRNAGPKMGPFLFNLKPDLPFFARDGKVVYNLRRESSAQQCFGLPEAAEKDGW